MTRIQSNSVHHFADLPQLYAEMTATPEFQRLFGEPLPLTIMQPGEEPGEHDMPEPLAVQADCGGIIACIFDLLADTRLETLAPEICWGIVNSFHFVAGKLERREDALAQELGVLARDPDPSEIYAREVEEKQLLCQSVAEQRGAVETMRDFAAEMYRALSGWPWSPSRGSRTSPTSASQVDALDFLRARQVAARERHDPQGPIVVCSGAAVWHDWQQVWERLDQIHARIPNMTIVTTGQRSGFDAIVAAWAASPEHRVTIVPFRLYGTGMRKAFSRNRTMVDLKPVEALLGEGSGIQANLYQSLRQQGVPIHAFKRGDQGPDTGGRPGNGHKARRYAPERPARVMN